MLQVATTATFTSRAPAQSSDLAAASAVAPVLSTSSTIEFSDGTVTYLANLANPTYIPANAMGFAMAFASTPFPPSMTAGASYDFTLVPNGIDDDASVYADSIVTAGRNSIFVRDLRIGVTAIPLQVETVHPGDRSRALLALDFANGYASDRVLDTLVVSNASLGPGRPWP